METSWDRDGVWAWIQTFGHEDEFIAVEKWSLDGRILTAGVVQQDTDLPVMAVVALEQPGRQA